jgi:hypothetical protein
MQIIMDIISTLADQSENRHMCSRLQSSTCPSPVMCWPCPGMATPLPACRRAKKYLPNKDERKHGERHSRGGKKKRYDLLLQRIVVHWAVYVCGANRREGNIDRLEIGLGLELACEDQGCGSGGGRWSSEGGRPGIPL